MRPRYDHHPDSGGPRLGPLVSGPPNEDDWPNNPAVRFEVVLGLTIEAFECGIDRDWHVLAGSLEWTCWQTVDHIIDCVFSYALQLASLAQDGFLPFGELHALAKATPRDLVAGMRGVGTMFVAVLREASGLSASDGLLTLDAADWSARGAYEVLLHTHDVMQGMHRSFEPSSKICTWLLDSPNLWMIDRARADGATDPWSSLLLGSGRAPASR
jgi:hypothetical protein